MKTVENVMGQLSVAMQQSESVADIINVAVTAEAMAVTLSGAAIAGAANYTNPDGSKGLPERVVSILKALQASEQAHYSFLTGAGAKPITLTFNIPDPRLATESLFLFQTVEALDTAFVAAYMTAARSFAEMKMPDLVKVAFQIGGVEAEHRALARLIIGEPLPHNLAYEIPLFARLADAAATLQRLGFIGGSGQALNYSDFANRVDFSTVTELTPGGPSVTALTGTPAGMPRTGDGGVEGEDRRVMEAAE